MTCIASYDKRSNWTLETLGGITGSKGFLGVVAGGIQTVRFEAQNINRSTHNHKKLTLEVTATGFEIGKSIGKDLLEELAGVSIEFVKAHYGEQPIYLNQKDHTELKMADMMGPCSLVTFDVGKVSLVKELKKYAGNTYLFIGQGKTVVDRSPDWLERMLKKLENGDTWGSYNKKFVKGYGVFSNARAVCKVEINGVGAAAKVDNKIGFYSGQITGSNFHTF